MGPKHIPDWVFLKHDLLKLEIAKTFKQKFLGLYSWLDWGDIPTGLLLLNCNSVHTLFMHCPIDIIYLNKSFHIIDIKESIYKNKIIYNGFAKHVIELPADYCANNNWRYLIQQAISKSIKSN